MKGGFSLLLLLIMVVSTACRPLGTTSELKFHIDINENRMINHATLNPDSFAAFKQTFYPYARNQACINCHHSNWTGAPLAAFADDDPEVAFNSIVQKQKVNLIDPELSRVVRKLVDESHNCWSDCVDNSNEILGHVELWRDMVPEEDRAHAVPL